VHFGKNGCLWTDSIIRGAVDIWQLDTSTKKQAVVNADEAILSVCIEDDASGLIALTYSYDNHLTLYRMNRIQKTKVSWKCRDYGGSRQVATSGDRIFLPLSLKNQIIVYTKAGLTELIMLLKDFSSPNYVVPYDDNSLIVSGEGGVGKFPVSKVSESLWVTRVEGTRGVCVDDTGLIYVAKNTTKAILILSSSG